LISAYPIRLRHGHGYSVQFVRINFYPTSPLCFKLTVIAWLAARELIFIMIGATQLIMHVAALLKRLTHLCIKFLRR